MRTPPNTSQPPRSLIKSLVLALTAGFLFMFHTPARALEVAGTLLIDLHYTSGITTVVDPAAPAETRVASWANNGVMGGTFIRNNLSPYALNGIGTGNFPPPKLEIKGGIMVPDSPAGRCLISTVATPPALQGANSWTMEMWYWPNVQQNDGRKFFAWTENLPDDGLHAGKFGHGPWGAQQTASQGVGGAADLLWDPLVPATGLTAGVWHHCVVTYDGTTQKTYLDGAFKNSQVIALNLSVLQYYPILFSGLIEINPAQTSFSANGAIAALRVHSGALLGPQVTLNNNDGPSATSGTTYSISGTVSTFNASDPVGALVELKLGGNVIANQTVPSGGAYSFNVQPGTYTVRASKAGFLPDQSGDIVVVASNVVENPLLAQDTVIPSWTGAYPLADSVGSTSFSARASLDEAGTAYYVVVADGDPAPTSAQVKAGTDSFNNPAIKFGSINVAAPNTEYSVSVTGLAPTSFFDVFFVAEDPAIPNNLQVTPVKRDIATLQNIYTESFNGGVNNQSISASNVMWEGAGIVQVVNNSVTPDGDSWYVAKWQTESGRMPLQTKIGETNTPILAANRINTTFTVDFAAAQTGGMRFTARVGGVRYGSDKFANVDATNGSFGAGSAVTSWATKSISVESSNWYLMPSDIDELISTTPIPLPPGDITQFGVYWNNENNGHQWAIDNFRVDATPPSSTYSWNGGAGNWADVNWSFGGGPAVAPATGFHMFINGGGTVGVAADFLSALSVNVGQTGTAGALTVNNAFTLGADQLNLGSSGTLQVDGTLTSPRVISEGTATISSTGVVNAGTIFQVLNGSLTSAAGSQLNIGTGNLLLSGGTGATIDGQLNITGGTVTLLGGTLTHNGPLAQPAVLVLKAGTLAGTGSVIPTSRYEVTNQTISGATGPAGLVAESGTVTLAGSNPYTGTTEIRAAEAPTYLRLADASLLSPGNLFFNGQGRFQQDARYRPATLETKGTIARNIGPGAGQIRFVTQVQDGKSAFSFAAVGGPLSVTLNGGASLNWGNTTTGLNNSYFEFGSPISDDVVTLNNPLTLTSNGDTVWVWNNTSSANDYAIITGAISGAFNFARRGAGRLVLQGVSTYTGTTHVNNEDSQTTGMLEIGGAGQLGSGTYNAQIDIDSNTTFKYNSTANQVLGGNIIDSGALIKDNVSTLTLTSNGSTHSGQTTVNGGTLLINGSSPGAGPLLVNSGGRLGGTGSKAGTVTIASGGILSLNLVTPFGTHDSLLIGTTVFDAGSVLEITGDENAAPGDYTLVTGGGATLPTTVNLPAGWAADPPRWDGGSLKLNITSTDSGFVFEITSFVRNPANGHVTITFTSFDSANYTIERSADGTTWGDVDDNVDGQAGTTTYVDTTAAPFARLLYRVTQN